MFPVFTESSKKGVFMQFTKLIAIPAVLVLCLSVFTGCASKPPEKTATQEGIERWNLAKAGVLYSLAKEQFENGNLDDSRKTLTKASAYAPKNGLIRILSAKVYIEQGQLEAAEV